jgi:hypothetical protein
LKQSPSYNIAVGSAALGCGLEGWLPTLETGMGILLAAGRGRDSVSLGEYRKGYCIRHPCHQSAYAQFVVDSVDSEMKRDDEAVLQSPLLARPLATTI